MSDCRSSPQENQVYSCGVPQTHEARGICLAFLCLSFPTSRMAFSIIPEVHFPGLPAKAAVGSLGAHICLTSVSRTLPHTHHELLGQDALITPYNSILFLRGALGLDQLPNDNSLMFSLCIDSCR